MNEEMSIEMDKLRSDIEALRADLASMAQSMKDIGARKTQELSDRAKDRAQEAEQRLIDEIVARPFASMLKAFGAGFIVARLLDD